ncbi:hypothetical protein PI126_g18709 [Phytophthora idaei]|nr:hypothetical protein PI126_g18709 [Phytophthora idaei]
MSTSPRTVHAYASFGKGEEIKPWEYQSRPLGAEDVEIKISHCGICGFDLHTLDSGWGQTTYPSATALVSACLNKDSKAPCSVCATGDDAYCPHRVWTYNDKYKSDGAITYGGYADYVRVPHEFAIKIPDNIPSDVAAPLMCAGTTVFTPFKEAGIKKGDRVGIVGIGGLGHIAIQFAKAMGAASVTAFSRSNNKEQEVRGLGADEFVVYTDEKQAKAAVGSVDILLITADANNMPYSTFLSFLAVRGTCIMVGLPNDDIKFNAFQVVGKGAKFVGSNVGSIQDMKDTLEVASKHNVRLVIQKLPMAKVNEGIDMVRKGTVRYRVVLEK